MIFCSMRVKRSSLQSCESWQLGIIRKGKTVWYPGLVMNADNDGNQIEVKFLYPSRNKRNKFNFGNADLVWCTVENVVLVCESPVCDQKELHSFQDNTINMVVQMMNSMK